MTHNAIERLKGVKHKTPKQSGKESKRMNEARENWFACESAREKAADELERKEPEAIA